MRSTIFSVTSAARAAAEHQVGMVAGLLDQRDDVGVGPHERAGAADGAAEARAYRRRANALAEKVEGKCGTQLARLEVGPDPYAEQARLAYERGEAATPY